MRPGKATFALCALFLASCSQSAQEEESEGPGAFERLGDAPLELDNENGFVLRDRGEGLEIESAAASKVRPTRPGEVLIEGRKSMPIRAAVSAPTAEQRLVSKASTLEAGATVSVTLQLEDLDFDFPGLRRAKGENRSDIVRSRKGQVEASQQGVLEKLRPFATNVRTFWLSNNVKAEVPADRISDIAGWPEVVSVSENDDEVIQAVAYSGNETHVASLAQQFYANGLEGQTGGRAGGTIRMGIIEADSTGTISLIRGHVGWLDCVGCGSKIRSAWNCLGGNCSATSATLTTYPVNNVGVGHGTLVSWVAAGSIQQGQDVNFPGSGTALQSQRSGQGKEIEIVYAMQDGCDATEAAVEKLVEEGVDIINMSFGLVGACLADPCPGLSTAIRNASNAGVLIVAAAGNQGNSTACGCTVLYPAVRSEVLAVGGLNSAPANAPYGTLQLFDNGTCLQNGGSSKGPMPITVDGVSRSTNVIGLTAPARYIMPFHTAPNSYYGDASGETSVVMGTSLASPAVAAFAGLLKEAFVSVGLTFAANNAYYLRTNMLLMGDSWDASTNTSLQAGMSDLSGAGRVRMHYPSSANLVSPWGWQSSSHYVLNGQTAVLTVNGGAPIPSGVTQWKWAVQWPESDFSQVSDIVIGVWDTCPAGGGGDVFIESDVSWNMTKKIDLPGSAIVGKCLEARIMGLSIPGGRSVFSADYFHSGDPTFH